MAPPNPFPHLPLVLRDSGPARLTGGGKESQATKDAKADRPGHGSKLKTDATSLSGTWKSRLEQRERDGLPTLTKGIPVLLEIDPSLDLEDLRKLFGFEIVAEHEDGFVIVATEDLDLSALIQKVNDFAGSIPGARTGASNVAKVHRLVDDPHLDERVKRVIPDDHLRARWPFHEEADYIAEAGIACTGTVEIPSRPNPPNRGRRESDRAWAKRQTTHTQKLSDWMTQRDNAYDEWERLRMARYDEVSSFVTAYGGEILGMFEPATDGVPDSFTLRVRIKGKGLRDFTLNYAFLFELVEPDGIELPQHVRESVATDRDKIELLPPPDGAPAVCIIDSGIQENHLWLEPAIDSVSSRSYLPGQPGVADEVISGGHGTRVAGAVLYGEQIPTTGNYQLAYWIQNARVLDGGNAMPASVFPPTALRAIVDDFHKKGRRKTRIFNHSINSRFPCRLRHMSSWAAEIDHLTTENDILFVQSTGNLYSSSDIKIQPGVSEHLGAGRVFPDFLNESSCRIANPAQSLNALTVGSVTYPPFADEVYQSIAADTDHPSCFSRTGYGIWEAIKPEVVEYGGDFLRDANNPPNVGTPAVGRDCYPELIRSTLHAPSPAYDRDDAGTSYAAPKVSRIAARLQEVLPDSPCLLYKTLIIQSARWPKWALSALPATKAQVIRWIGYGIPNTDRATTNTDYRTTLISSDERNIRAGECHVYQVPIPKELRRPGDEFDVLIEVTLTYAAPPRRTRRNLRRYLSTWADWKSSRAGESLDAFRRRVLKTEAEAESEAEGTSFRWAITSKSDAGIIRGGRRNAGTTQKDWAFVKSNSLPEHFSIAVMGHQGWSRDPDSTARYVLAVSLEVVGQEVAIYEKVRVSVEQLQAEIDAETEVEVEVPGGE